MRTMIGFGASSVQGVGDPEGGFVARVAQHLKGDGSQWTVVNLGVGGDTTREMLARARARARQVSSPGGEHEVVVLLGCNDVPRANDGVPARRTGIAEYRGNLEEILDLVKGKRAMFISSFRVCEDRTGVSTQTLRQYMDVAMEVAQAKGYDLWDLFAETLNDGAKYWAADGMHFNGAGHQLIAERVLNWLELV